MIMSTKYLILVIISASLVSALYSSSLSIVFAALTNVECNSTNNDKDILCTWRNKKGQIVQFDYCYVDGNGKFVCIEVPTGYTQPIPESKLPIKLTDALSAATEEIQNEPKVPRDLRGLNDKGITINPGQ